MSLDFLKDDLPMNRQSPWLLGLVACALTTVYANENDSAANEFVKIVRPKDGTVVRAGQTIEIEVEAAPSSNLKGVGVVATNDIPASEFKSAPPYRVHITLPNDIAGSAFLTATGGLPDGAMTMSKPISIAIEPQGEASGMFEVNLRNSPLHFSHPGAYYQLLMEATLSDGKPLSLHGSPLLHFQSRDAKVVTVDARGAVVAVGPGSAQITVSYHDQVVVIPVTVKATIVGDLNGDGKVDKEDLAYFEMKLQGFSEIEQRWQSMRRSNPNATEVDFVSIIPDSLSLPVDAMGPTFKDMDANGDGKIDANDAKEIIRHCTFPNCATH